MLEIVKLRDERARLLGYKNHATFVLEQRMAETSETVMAFLEKMKKAYKPAALKDLKQLQDFTKSIGGPADLKPWDVAGGALIVIPDTFTSQRGCTADRGARARRRGQTPAR